MIWKVHEGIAVDGEVVLNKNKSRLKFTLFTLQTLQTLQTLGASLSISVSKQLMSKREKEPNFCRTTKHVPMHWPVPWSHEANIGNRTSWHILSSFQALRDLRWHTLHLWGTKETWSLQEKSLWPTLFSKSIIFSLVVSCKQSVHKSRKRLTSVLHFKQQYEQGSAVLWNIPEQGRYMSWLVHHQISKQHLILWSGWLQLNGLPKMLSLSTLPKHDCRSLFIPNRSSFRASDATLTLQSVGRLPMCRATGVHYLCNAS